MLTFSPHPSTSLSFYDREELGPTLIPEFQDGRQKSARLFLLAFFVTSESGLKKADLFVFYVGVASY